MQAECTSMFVGKWTHSTNILIILWRDTASHQWIALTLICCRTKPSRGARSPSHSILIFIRIYWYISTSIWHSPQRHYVNILTSSLPCCIHVIWHMLTALSCLCKGIGILCCCRASCRVSWTCGASCWAADPSVTSCKICCGRPLGFAGQREACCCRRRDTDGETLARFRPFVRRDQ